ncbi:MAG: hypothetical protein ACKOPT_15600 [Cyanobium sp.]
MPLQTRTVVADTFARLRHGLEQIETDLTARALRLNAYPEEAADVCEVIDDLLCRLEETRHWPGT